MKVKRLPVVCPACEGRLNVEKLHCHKCGTVVEGSFTIPVFLQLSQEEQQFVLTFLTASGSLKEMARHLGYSYPKVRNMLDDVIHKIQKAQAQLSEDFRNE